MYEELRRLAVQKLAHENPGQTLQAAALVHKTYIRLVDTDKAQRWDSCKHFLPGHERLALPASSTALLVIDMQKYFVHPHFH